MTERDIKSNTRSKAPKAAAGALLEMQQERWQKC
jgi:hypothetical protein